MRRTVPSTDSGFSLVEILVAVVIAGAVLPAIATMLVTSVRISSAVERKVERSNLAGAAAMIASEQAAEPCPTDTAIVGELDSRLTLPPGWSWAVAVDCSEPPALVLIDLYDTHNGVTTVSVGLKS